MNQNDQKIRAMSGTTDGPTATAGPTTIHAVAEFNIRMHSDGSINVTGPIENFFLFRNVMNLAEQAVMDHIAKKSMRQKSNIVVPNIVVPGMNVPKN